MHREHICRVHRFVEGGDAPNPQRAEALVAHIRIVAGHVHPERVRAGRDLAPDTTHADDHERAPLDLRPEELGAVPLAVVHRRRGVRQMAEQPDQRAEEELRHRDRVPSRRVDHRHPQLGGRINGDVVHADAGASDDPQPRRPAQELVRDPRRAPPHEGVVRADPLQQFGRRQRRLHVHLERGLGLQQRDTVGVDFVGDEQAVPRVDAVLPQ